MPGRIAHLACKLDQQSAQTSEPGTIFEKYSMPELLTEVPDSQGFV
jgi:hypothetical protein